MNYFIFNFPRLFLKIKIARKPVRIHEKQTCAVPTAPDLIFPKATNETLQRVSHGVGAALSLDTRNTNLSRVGTCNDVPEKGSDYE